MAQTKYLDKTGLNYFWGKIKDRIDESTEAETKAHIDSIFNLSSQPQQTYSFTTVEPETKANIDSIFI